MPQDKDKQDDLAQQRDKAEFQALNDNPKLGQIAEQLDVEYYQRWVEESDPVKQQAIWYKAVALREILALIKHMAAEKAEPEATI